MNVVIVSMAQDKFLLHKLLFVPTCFGLNRSQTMLLQKIFTLSCITVRRPQICIIYVQIKQLRLSVMKPCRLELNYYFNFNRNLQFKLLQGEFRRLTGSEK
jgi:hypothetical protein